MSRARAAAVTLFLSASLLAGCGGSNDQATQAFCTALDEGRAEAAAVAESVGDLSTADLLRQRRALEQTADRVEDAADDVSSSTERALDRAFDSFDDRLEDLAGSGSADQRRAGAQTALEELDTALNTISTDTRCE